MLVGSSLTSTEVATLGTELLTYKFSGAASSAVVARIQFSLSTLQSFTVQLSAEIAGVQVGKSTSKHLLDRWLAGGGRFGGIQLLRGTVAAACHR